jgi:DNA gyrase inhibitor GyrI
MPPEPKLVEVPPLVVAALHARGPYWKLSPAVIRLKDWMAGEGLRAEGPLVGIFPDDPDVTPPERCRYVLAYPVPPEKSGPAAALTRAPAGAPAERAAAGPNGGEFMVQNLPGGLMAQLDYQGPAAESPQAYVRLQDWIAKHSLRPAGPPREVYLTEPGSLRGALMKALLLQPVAPAE